MSSGEAAASQAGPLRGHGVLVERPWEQAAAGPPPFVRRVFGLGAHWVGLKLASRATRWPPEPTVEVIRACVEPLRRRGIAVWGWGSVSGNAPATEAGLAMESLVRYGLEGWIFEVGAAFPDSIAIHYRELLHSQAPAAGAAFFVSSRGSDQPRRLHALADAADALLFAVGAAGEVGLSPESSRGHDSPRIPVLQLPEPWSMEAGASSAGPGGRGESGPDRDGNGAGAGEQAKVLEEFLSACRAAERASAVLSLDRAQRSRHCAALLEAWKRGAR